MKVNEERRISVKKLISAVLATVMLTASLFGCTQNDAPSGSSDTNSGSGQTETKTIKFLTVGDPYVGAIKTLLPEFEEKYNIKVVLDSVPYLDLHGKAILELTSDTGAYDLISVDSPWIGEFAEGDHLLDLNELVERDKEELQVDDFLPGAWEGLATWDDRIIGLPLAPYYMYIHYRTDLFAEKNLEAPVTKDEFVNAIETLYDPDNNHYGLAIALKRGPSIVHDWCAYFNAFGGKMFNDMPNDYSSGVNSDIAIETCLLYTSPSPRD